MSTAFGAEDPGTSQRLFLPVMRPFMKTLAKGAARQLWQLSANLAGLESVQ